MKNKYNKIEIEFLNLLRAPVKSKEDMQILEKLRISLEEESKILQKELLNELKDIGINIFTVWDLVNTTSDYEIAVPVLISHLHKDYPDKIKEGIIRSLAIKSARGKAGKVLIEEFHRTSKQKSLLRWTIGNTMVKTISHDNLPEVLDIVSNRENGYSREMFVVALGNIKSEQSEQILISLLDDDEVAVNALQALGKLKSIKSKEKISQLSYHSESLIRKEAQKTLKKIG